MTVFRNKYRWDDKNVTDTTRMSTFDGATQDVEIKVLTSPQLVKTIETLCKAISTHIWEVSGNTTQISIMTLYLQRADSESVCKLLFCTQLKARKLSPHKIERKNFNFSNRLVLHEPKFISSEEVNEDYHKAVMQKIKINSQRQGLFRAIELKPAPKKKATERSVSKEAVPLVKVKQIRNCSVCLGSQIFK